MRIVTQIMLYNETNSFKNIDVRLVRENFNGTLNVLATETIKVLGSPLSDPHGTFSVSVNVTLSLGDKVYVEARTHTGTSSVIRQGISADNDASWIKVLNYGSDAVDFETILSESRGKIKQWEFIKSFMNMFNLLIMPTENPNRFKIEPYNDVFGVFKFAEFIADSSFDDTTDYNFDAFSSGVSGSLIGGGQYQLTTNGTQFFNYQGGYGYYYNLIDGETYQFNVDMDSVSNGGQVDAYFYKGSNVGAKLTFEEGGKQSKSFVFDRAANGGSSAMRFRMSMFDGTSLSYNCVINSISLTGKVLNDISKKDWTNKIDEDTFKIEMQDLDKTVDFKFTKDDSDYVSKIYSEATS